MIPEGRRAVLPPESTGPRDEINELVDCLRAVVEA
jgi:hypothetical protein